MVYEIKRQVWGEDERATKEGSKASRQADERRRESQRTGPPLWLALSRSALIKGDAPFRRLRLRPGGSRPTETHIDQRGKRRSSKGAEKESRAETGATDDDLERQERGERGEEDRSVTEGEGKSSQSLGGLSKRARGFHLKPQTYAFDGLHISDRRAGGTEP